MPGVPCVALPGHLDRSHPAVCMYWSSSSAPQVTDHKLPVSADGLAGQVPGGGGPREARGVADDEAMNHAAGRRPGTPGRTACTLAGEAAAEAPRGDPDAAGGQAEVGAVERREREHLSMLVRTRRRASACRASAFPPLAV